MQSLENLNAEDGEIAEAGKETPWEEATPWENAKVEGRYLLRAYLWLFALAFASALLTPRDILTSHLFLRDFFIGFSDIIGFLFHLDIADEFSDYFHFNEVALFTAALLNIASILLIASYPRLPSARTSLNWLLFQCFLMTSFIVWPISFCKKMLSFYNGLLQNGYISNEVAGFMFDSRMGLALVFVLLMMIAPIFVIAFRFFMNFLFAPSSK